MLILNNDSGTYLRRYVIFTNYRITLIVLLDNTNTQVHYKLDASIAQKVPTQIGQQSMNNISIPYNTSYYKLPVANTERKKF